MRGKLRLHPCGELCQRIIPAHAGQTRSSGCRTLRAADHPRACGANVTARPMAPSRCGSSPRMRGKRRLVREQHHRIRIIPAHAGQTASGRPEASCSADHPRACGANKSLSRMSPLRNGSSPRMRGKLLRCRIGQDRHRIIPAHAGQTGGAVRPPRRCPDHPRACGANSTLQKLIRALAGSSPRMRGKPSATAPWRTITRIIPAHAGQTPWIPVPLLRHPDHPRACGANLAHAFGNLFAIGSSPRMRGKRNPAIWLVRS